MRTTGLGAGLLAMLALASTAIAANLVVNGDFSGGYYADQGYNCPNGWMWYPRNLQPALGVGALYSGDDLGPGGTGDTCWRLRLNQNVTAETVLYQVIDTVPGQTYTVSAQWRSATAKGKDNPNYAWCGVLFMNGGTPGDRWPNQYMIDPIVASNLGIHQPSRWYWPYNPPEVSTQLILPPNKEIVAERAMNYGMPFDNWETIHDGAGGAGDPTMPGIGESAANGGGAAWQTKIATGDHMLVGFFELDTPSTQGGGSDLYVDNVSVTEMQPPCPMDLDGDGDVDEADFGLFLSCASGSGVPDNGTSVCQKADFDGDGDVDMDDFGRLQRCYAGSGVPINNACCQ